MVMITLMSILPAMMIPFMSHPLSLGGILLIHTILITLISGMMNLTFWYSYILFLIMIGGMLVLFVYMTNVASNEKFKLSITMMMMLLFSMPTMFLIVIYFDQWFPNLKMFMFETLNSFNPLFSLNKYLNFPAILISLILIIYLLITLIIVIKITKFMYGPLRHYN